MEKIIMEWDFLFNYNTLIFLISIISAYNVYLHKLIAKKVDKSIFEEILKNKIDKVEVIEAIKKIDKIEITTSEILKLIENLKYKKK